MLTLWRRKFSIYLQFIYLSIYLYVPLSIYLSFSLSIYLSNFISIYLSDLFGSTPDLTVLFEKIQGTQMYPSVSLSFFPSIYLSTYLSIYLFIYLLIYLSIYLPIYLSFYFVKIHSWPNSSVWKYSEGFRGLQLYGDKLKGRPPWCR